MILSLSAAGRLLCGLGLAALLPAVACGARSGLPTGDDSGGAGGAGGCVEGTTERCGSDVGACLPGVRSCVQGVLGECRDAVGPAAEVCNGLDDDCDGEFDEGFGLGQACDGPDTDLCADDVMTCDGCSAGPDLLEVCNGKDDDCDGIVDADCVVGGCTPELVVGDLQKSMRSCFVDSVQPGSSGSLEFPCTGGPVSATFGPILFTGSVTDGVVSLTATTTFPWGDGCTWASSQTISGALASGALAYTYAEDPIEGVGCLPPCSATGTIQVAW